MIITSNRYEVIFDIDNIKSVYPINNIIYKTNKDSNIVTFSNICNLFIFNELIDNIKVNDTMLTNDNIFSLLDVIFDGNKKNKK